MPTVQRTYSQANKTNSFNKIAGKKAENNPVQNSSTNTNASNGSLNNNQEISLFSSYQAPKADDSSDAQPPAKTDHDIGVEKSQKIKMHNDTQLNRAGALIKYITEDASTPNTCWNNVTAMFNGSGLDAQLSTLKNEIDALKVHNPSMLHSKSGLTKSQAQAMALVYILCLSSQTSNAPGRSTIAVKDAFKLETGRFSVTKFNKFLIESKAVDSQAEADKIMSSCSGYLKKITFDGTFFIRFDDERKIDLTSQLSAGHLNGNSSKALKSDAMFPVVDIKAKKSEARQYFNDIKTLIENPGVQNERIESGAFKYDKKDIIFQITTILKVINLVLRTEVNTNFSYRDLVKLITPAMEKVLNLETEESKIKFIQHCIFLSTHTSPQALAKRIFVQLPVKFVTFGFIIGPLLSVGSHFGKYVLEAISNHVESPSSQSSELSNVLGIAGFGVQVRQYMKDAKTFLTVDGDLLTSYTSGAKQVFQELSTLYDRVDKDSNAVSASQVPVADSGKKIWESNLWQKTPTTHRLLSYMINKPDDLDKMEIIVKNGYLEGVGCRNMSIDDLKARVEPTPQKSDVNSNTQVAPSATTLELETKKLELETKKLELETKKLELETRKLELETRKLELENALVSRGVSSSSLSPSLVSSKETSPRTSAEIRDGSPLSARSTDTSPSNGSRSHTQQISRRGATSLEEGRQRRRSVGSVVAANLQPNSQSPHTGGTDKKV